MNKAKEKAIKYLNKFNWWIPSDIDEKNKEVRIFNHSLDIAIKETIDDRDRIHKINLECARQVAKKEVFDDIEAALDFYKTVFIEGKFEEIRDEHLNTYSPQ